ncbi:MAG: helix-turn-helix transcriptional regulator [Fimbriimonadales bacterium]
MVFRPDLKALVLAVLKTDPQHGYAIVKRIRESSSGAFRLGEGQLYPLLHRLEKTGLIVSEWETPESGPARKLYRLTDRGEEELARCREDWSRFVENVNSVMSVRPEVSNA